MNPMHHSGSKGIVFAKPKDSEPTRKPSSAQKKYNDARVEIELRAEQKRLNEELGEF